MIKILNTTEKYNIEPKKLVASSFDAAYEKTSVTTPVNPPDKITTVFSIISMLLLAGMLFLTAKYDKSKDANPAIWYSLGTACFGIIAFIITKYIKSVKLYAQSKSTSKTSVMDKKKEAFYDLLDMDETPDVCTASELQRKVSPLLGKQTDVTYLAALRTLNEKLSHKNNPEDLLCKMISTTPDVFTQPKRRLYMKEKDGSIVFYDSDFMNPIGEIVCDIDDVVGFGEYAKYPNKINNPGGGKIRPESIVVEIKDEKNNLFFEFRSEDYDVIRKVLGGRKELRA